MVEGAGGADQFFQVFGAGLTLFAFFLFVEFQQATFFYDVIGLLVQANAASPRIQPLDQFP